VVRIGDYKILENELDSKKTDYQACEKDMEDEHSQYAKLTIRKEKLDSQIVEA
jgi:hypothetical protein